MTNDEMTAVEELRAALANEAEAKRERDAAHEICEAAGERLNAAYSRSWAARDALFALVSRSVEGEPVTA